MNGVDRCCCGCEDVAATCGTHVCACDVVRARTPVALPQPHHHNHYMHQCSTRHRPSDAILHQAIDYTANSSWRLTLPLTPSQAALLWLPAGPRAPHPQCSILSHVAPPTQAMPTPLPHRLAFLQQLGVPASTLWQTVYSWTLTVTSREGSPRPGTPSLLRITIK